MRNAKSLFLILIALWLPLQAAAAVAMPFCRHAHEAPQADMSKMEMPCHEHEQSGHATDDTPLAANAACDNCEMCHLATAGFLPVDDGQVTVRMLSVLVEHPAVDSPSFIADIPDHPPRPFR